MRIFDPKRAKAKAVVGSVVEFAPPAKPAEEPKPLPPAPKATDWPALWRQLIEALSAIANKVLARQDAIDEKRTSELEQATDALIKTVQEVGKTRRPTAWTVEILKTDRNGNATKLRLTPDTLN